MKTRLFSLFLALFCLSLVGCQQDPEPQTAQIFAMDTIMSLTVYGDSAQEGVTDGVSLIYHLEDLLSVTDETSEIHQLNHSDGQWVSLSQETFHLLSAGARLAEETDGAVDPTIYPIVQAWGFTTGDYAVPSQEALDSLLDQVDFSQLELDEATTSARLPAGMQLDLGAVAKGYTADCLAELFADADISSAVLSLGGNVQAVGAKPDGSPWKVGIQDPNSSDSAYLGALEVMDQAVVTSGGYQRYFEEDGTLYHHIIDPSTGYPAQNGLLSVTVVGDSGLYCDALSTALFVMGEADAIQFWQSHQDFDCILIRDDGSLVLTQALAEAFTLVEGYEDYTIEVISPEA